MIIIMILSDHSEWFVGRPDAISTKYLAQIKLDKKKKNGRNLKSKKKTS